MGTNSSLDLFLFRSSRTTTLKSARCSLSVDGFPFVLHVFCITPPSPTNTGRRASNISSWKNAQACLSVALSMACPPSNLTRSLISCSSSSMRCPQIRARRSALSLAGPTTTGTCLIFGTLHTHCRVLRSIDHYRKIFLEFCGTFSWTGRGLQLSFRLLNIITRGSGSIAGCMIRNGCGDAFSPAFSQVCVGRRRSRQSLRSFEISTAMIRTLDSVTFRIGPMQCAVVGVAS